VARKSLIGSLLFCSCLALGALSVGAKAQHKKEVSYDGHWWLSISPGERSGFLNGYLDCYTYEYKGPAEFTVNPPAVARDLVTEFYEASPCRLSESVPDALNRFSNRHVEKVTPTGGQPIKGRHGFYDGTYWKQISAIGGKAEQLGFVEGYLCCHSHVARNEGGIFSKAPSEYVPLITRWYGFVEETGDVNAKREPAKIADVVFKFRDHGPDSKPASK